MDSRSNHPGHPNHPSQPEMAGADVDMNDESKGGAANKDEL